jgi:hypothetical protein
LDTIMTARIAKKTVGEGVTASHYDLAEGYSSDYANIRSIALAPNAIQAGGPDASLSFRFSGNAVEHLQKISLNDQELLTLASYGFEVKQETVAIPTN